MAAEKDPEGIFFKTLMNKMLADVSLRTKVLWWELCKARYRKESGEPMDAYELFFEALRQAAWEVDLRQQGHSMKEVEKMRELNERERNRRIADGL